MHRRGSVDPIVRPDAAGGIVAVGREQRPGPVEPVDDVFRHGAAAVVALVDDQTGLAELGEVLAVEGVAGVVAGAREVDVAELGDRRDR
jgi:2-keto-3-deoxy-L-rhamnonate aldolase RhmA